MMISEPQYRTLVALLVSILPVVVNGQTIVDFVGEAAAPRVPTAARLDTVARWIVDEVLRQTKPDRFVRVIRVVDNEDARISSLVELANRLDSDPAKWKPLGGARP